MPLYLYCTVGMFRVNPAERPSINDVVERLEEIGEAKKIKLTGALPQSLLTDPSIQPGTEKPRIIV